MGDRAIAALIGHSRNRQLSVGEQMSRNVNARIRQFIDNRMAGGLSEANLCISARAGKTVYDFPCRQAFATGLPNAFDGFGNARIHALDASCGGSPYNARHRKCRLGLFSMSAQKHSRKESGSQSTALPEVWMNARKRGGGILAYLLVVVHADDGDVVWNGDAHHSAYG